MQPQPRPIGEQIRDWRQLRRRSQLDLALDAAISTRHLSFIETGRSRPSRDMVLQIARELDVPLRERNAMLLAAGFAPVYGEHDLGAADMAAARAAIEFVLQRHEPYPALAVDRHWTLVSANQAVGALIASASAELLEPPINVLRLSLHPQGIAPRIVNLAEWRAHILERLKWQVAATADRVLAALLDELAAYPASDGAGSAHEVGGVLVPLRLASPVGELSFLSTTTVFGTPTDITLAELAIESFFPANDVTGQRLRNLAATA